MQGVEVWSLVGELGFCMPCGQKYKKQDCNRFNKDFLNGPHQKKKKTQNKKREDVVKGTDPEIPEVSLDYLGES